MNDPIAMLKKDHREVAELLKRLAASKPGPRRRTVVTKLASDLQLHMQFEEAEIYPLLGDRIGEEPAEEATIEHGLARRGVEQLRELVDAPGFGAVVAMLAAGIRHHVKRRGRTVPEAEEAAGSGDAHAPRRRLRGAEA